MSEGSFWPKTWKEAIPLILWGTLIFAAGFEGIATLVHGEWLSSLASFIIMVGLMAVLIHWKQWLASIDPNWLVGAVIVALIVITFSPFVEQQRWPFASLFRAAPAPSADEISDAVVRKLPKGGTIVSAPSGAATIATSPYVNPLHEKTTKWQIVQGLRMEILRNNVNAGCKIIVVRYPEAYSEDYAADFKEILDVIGWKYDERFADRTLEKGLSVRMIGAPGPSMECGTALALRLHNDMRTRSGSSPNIGPMPLLETEAPDYLRNCPTGCVEVDFGNEDTTR